MFDYKNIKQNSKFILISAAVILIAVVFSAFFNTNDKKLKNADLEENGDSKISKLVINELMTSNGGVYADKNGNLYDWLELYNGSKKDINLKNYGLTDKENTVKWVFPEIIIKSGEYLVINLSGTTEDELHAAFKLSSSGSEIVAIKSPSGKVVDAVETVKIKKDESLARNLKGEWVISKEPTPGFSNTKEGLESYHKSLIGTEEDIKINEVLVKNNGNFIDENNDLPGFIEIINTGKKTVNIKNYSISNTINVPYRWQFPDIELKPNQTIVVYTNSKMEELTTTFNFEKKKGQIVLTNNKGKIIDSIEYNDLPNGYVLKREDNEFYQTNVISPGFNNDKSGEEAYAKQNQINKNDLIINEVMNKNYSYLPSNGGEYYDWIELKNNSKKTINLKDYYLSNDEDNKKMYNLPDVELQPNQYYVIMASGDVNLSSTYKHANFKISDNESLFLTKKDKIIDSMFIANIPTGYSMGRSITNGFYYFNTPTPLKENADGKIEVAIVPSFNTKGGIFNNTNNIKIELKSSGKIFYTLNGERPTINSNLYNGPITIDKTTVVKAVSYEEGKVISNVATETYIVNENHTLPVLSISVNASDLNYLNAAAMQADAEVSANAELYEDGKNFNIPCGLTLFGGSARSLPKKSYTLRFRKKYGKSALNYQVFDNRDFSSFNTLVIRSGSQDNEKSFIRDILMTSLVDDGTDLDVQAYKTVILYINGKYYGLFNIREKVEDEFVANHYNVEQDKSNIIRIDGDVSSGSISSYRDLMDYISSHDLSIQKNYEYVKTKINIENLCDYWASSSYTANNDIINTRMFSHPDIDDGRWHFIFYDQDYGMYNVKHNYYNFSINPEGMSDFKVSTFLLRNLMKNKEFRLTYAERISYNLKNTWSKEKILNRIDEIYKNILPEIKRDRDRWNLSYEEWEKEIQKLKNYAKERETYMIKYVKSFLQLSDKEMKKYFGEWL